MGRRWELDLLKPRRTLKLALGSSGSGIVLGESRGVFGKFRWFSRYSYRSASIGSNREAFRAG